MIQVGFEIEGRKVLEMGELQTFGCGLNNIIPARLDNGRYVVIAWNNDIPPTIWEPNNPKALAALETTVAMPEVLEGVGSDTVHVLGKDKDGEFLIKLFYNRKGQHRHDELCRQ